MVCERLVSCYQLNKFSSKLIKFYRQATKAEQVGLKSRDLALQEEQNHNSSITPAT